jgi:hypothetical protein
MTKREAKAECLLPQRTGCAFHGPHHGLYRRFVFGVASKLTLVFGGPRSPCCTPLHFLGHYLVSFDADADRGVLLQRVANDG